MELDRDIHQQNRIKLDLIKICYISHIHTIQQNLKSKNLSKTKVCFQTKVKPAQAKLDLIMKPGQTKRSLALIWTRPLCLGLTHAQPVCAEAESLIYCFLTSETAYNRHSN